jgi:yeast amino acid transporter
LIFNWLLALTAIAYFFVWGSICGAHIRFRIAWRANGRSLDELPYKAGFGVIGSWIGLILNILSLMASIYMGVSAIDEYGNAAPWSTEGFFEQCLAIPCLIFFYVIWKGYSWFYVPQHRRMWTDLSTVDIYAGMRPEQLAISGPHVSDEERIERIAQMQEMKKGDTSIKGRLMAIITSCV